MHLAALLPRPLTPENGPESPTIMNCLLTGVHLERRRARAVGWRGVRASAGGMPAWTCRVAGTPHVYGLVFCEEHSNGEALHPSWMFSRFGLWPWPWGLTMKMPCVNFLCTRLPWTPFFWAMWALLPLWTGAVWP